MVPEEYTALWIKTFKQMLWVCQYELDNDFDVGIDAITFQSSASRIGNMNATRVYWTYPQYRYTQSLSILSATKVAILEECLDPYVERGFPGVYFQGILD